MIHHAVGFVLTFHGGALDGLTSKWCEIYDDDAMRHRPSILYAREHLELIEVSRRPRSGFHRYEVVDGPRELLLDLHFDG